MIHRTGACALAAAMLAGCSGGPAAAPSVAAAPQRPAQCAAPVPPAYASLQAQAGLPNPFVFQDGRAVASKADWQCRRSELQALTKQFEFGDKPVVTRDAVQGQFQAGSISVSITHAGKTISFPATISYPSTGKAPYPAMIGVGMVSLNQQELLKQGIALISFPQNEVAEQLNAGSRGKGKFYELYGSEHSAGAMMAWSWGISRLIDALEKTPQANIDAARLGVTGCSRNGKGAIVAGAFDERIKLTIAQESGSGGAAGWRVSNAQLAAGQNVQTLRQIVQENVWFTASFKQFAESAERLPFDQHAVMGLIAPRALLVLENTSMEWLGNQSAYINSLAAREIWTAHGAPEAMGISQVGGHPHCQLPASQFGHVNQFARRYLIGEQGVNTTVLESDGSFAKYLSAWVRWTTPALH